MSTVSFSIQDGYLTNEGIVVHFLNHTSHHGADPSHLPPWGWPIKSPTVGPAHPERSTRPGGENGSPPGLEKGSEFSGVRAALKWKGFQMTVTEMLLTEKEETGGEEDKTKENTNKKIDVEPQPGDLV